MKPSNWKIFIVLVLVLTPSGLIAGESDEVMGKGCSPLESGDRREVREKAKINAQQNAVKMHSVWVESIQGLENKELENQILQHIIRYYFKVMRQEPSKIEKDNICLTVHGKISAELIRTEANRLKEQDSIVQLVDNPKVNSPSDFELKIWVDKVDGRYVEGEKMVVFVRSEIKSYILLDYYQANNKVVHLLPNWAIEKSLGHPDSIQDTKCVEEGQTQPRIVNGRAELEPGKTYKLGGECSLFLFEVSKPYGSERIQGIANTKPFQEDFIPHGQQSSGKYHARKTRGILVKLREEKNQDPQMKIAVSTVEVFIEGKPAEATTDPAPGLAM